MKLQFNENLLKDSFMGTFFELLIGSLFRLINFFLLHMCHSVMTVHELSVNSKLLELPTSK